MGKIKSADRFSQYCKKGTWIFLMVPLLLAGCGKNSDEDILGQLKLFETNRYQGEEVAEERIAELKAAIKRYEAAVAEKVDVTAQLGEHYKMLAVEFINREMYGEALRYLENALDIYPENEVVYYLAGMCSGRMGKRELNNPAERENYFNRSEKYYLRAIELDPRFVQALYGLSVLYVFEMDRTIDAEPYLERIMEFEKQNVSAMFLLARVYAFQDKVEQAADLYDRIMEVSNSDEEKKRAAENKGALLEGSYE